MTASPRGAALALAALGGAAVLVPLGCAGEAGGPDAGPDDDLVVARGEDLQGYRTPDLDGDGDPDVLVAWSVGGSAEIVRYENDGAGSFERAATVDGGVEVPVALAVADLDGDGDPDLAAGSRHRIAWYENQGEGELSGPRAIETRVRKVEELAAADLDGDGDPDLVAAASGGDTLLRYENAGGSFSPAGAVPAEPGLVRSLRAADLDGDGDADLLTVSWRPPPRAECCIHPAPSPDSLASTPADTGSSPEPGLAWHENGQDGFSRRGVDGDPGGDPRAADLDGDGDLDVLAGGAWYANDGHGSFSRARTVAGAREIRSAAAGDVDGDGDADLLVSGGGRLTWYENEGGGSFAAAGAVSRVTDLASLSVVDVDGDGDGDGLSVLPGTEADVLAWIENAGGSLRVTTRARRPEPPADPTAAVRGDSVILRWSPSGADDLQGYLVYRRTSSFGPGPPGRADSYTLSGTGGRTTQVDADVRPGRTYYYRVTALDRDGNESEGTREVKVSVPAGGSPP